MVWVNVGFNRLSGTHPDTTMRTLTYVTGVAGTAITDTEP